MAQFKIITILLLVFLEILCAPLSGPAQVTFPEYTDPYLQTEVTTIYVNLPADSVLDMILGGDDSHYYQAQFIYESSTLTDTIENAGISLRGNSSLNAYKKSYKISFDEFNNNRTWQDVDQLNLVAQHNDPSLLRSPLSHAMYRFMGIASPRTSFTRFYVNGEYFGLYLNQEHIDGEFAKKYFDDQGDGNLYKCTYPATLEYISDDPEDYQFANWDTRHYDLKTNEWKDDYSDLAHLIDVINNTNDASIECELSRVLDVDGFIRAAAVEILIGHWDSYIYNKNNFYLYHNQVTDQFEFIPYDMDNTFGIDWVGQDWVDRSIYNFRPSGDTRPLYDLIMDVDVYRDRFSYYIEYLTQNYFNEDVLISQANAWQSMIEEAALEDTYRTLDYGFDNDAFLNGIQDAWGEHVEYGIEDYVNFRTTNALLELDPYDDPATLVSWFNYPKSMSEAGDFARIEAEIKGINSDQSVLYISTDNVNFNAATGFNDDGNSGDLVADDGIYTWESNESFGSDKLWFHITTSEGDEFPCTPKFAWLTPLSTGIYVNEVMSKNNSTISYNGLNYPDWLELWNSNSNSTNLYTWCLTDDVMNWNKFQFTSVSFSGGEFKIIWLDNDPELGPEHTTFQLTDSDSTIWLLSIQQGEPRIVDQFYPCEAPDDISQERITDGSATIAPTDQPTPGASNGIVFINDITNSDWIVYPNPTQDMVLFGRMCNQVVVTDMSGKLVITAQNTNQISLANLEQGIYQLNLDGEIFRVVHLN